MKPNEPAETVRRTTTHRWGTEHTMDLGLGKAVVPVTWIMPHAAVRTAVMLLLHGLSSNKERMSSSVGRVLIGYGIASLAIDLPLHGARTSGAAGIPASELRNPIVLARRWRAALAECRDALRALGQLPEVDAGRIAIVGYSMGSFIALMLGGDDPDVRALVLGAGGDLPADLPFGPVIRTLVDPVRAVRKFAGRPLLLVHGRHDRTILPEQATRLFDAAGEPKRLLWYNGGHWLPDNAIRHAVRWLAPILGVPAV